MSNFETIAANPTSIFALIGVLILIFFVLYIRKMKFTTKILVHISMMLALAIILNAIRIYHFPQGGSVTPGGMIPLLLISFRYGAGVGTLTGFLFGLMNLIQDPFIVHPVQVLFDYPLPFMSMGIAGLGIFAGRKFLGTIAAFLGRFVFHFMSGIIFFANYAPPEMSPAYYSLTVNGMMVGAEVVICLIILKVLPLERILAAMK